MAEPTSVTAASLAATASAISLAMFGVDYYSMLYALVGALIALGHADKMTWPRAVVYVVLATLIGAVIGTATNEYFGLKSRILLIGLCLVGGIIAQAIAGALVKFAPHLAQWGIETVEELKARWARGGRS